MKYLAIDTSNKSLNVAVNNGEKTFIYRDENCGVRHSEEVMVRVEELLSNASVSLSDLDFIACVVGAGSFTGIRIGVSTVKALCFASKKPFLALTSFDTIAYNKPIGKVLAVINAGHDGFYVCGYEDSKIVLKPSYILKPELLALKEQYKLLSFESIADIGIEVVNPANGLVCAVEDKKNAIEQNLDLLVPLYVRKSQAEEGRP